MLVHVCLGSWPDLLFEAAAFQNLALAQLFGAPLGICRAL
jgi:hypothetical protein